MAVEGLDDRRLWPEHPERTERKDRREEDAGDESEMVKNELQWIRERTRIMSHRQRPKRPKPRQDNQDPGNNLGSKDSAEKHHELVNHE